MFKSFSNILNKNIRSIHRLAFPRHNFSKKFLKTTTDLQVQDSPEGPLQSEETKSNYKIYEGVYPYFPVDDHPIIPGYGRIIIVSQQILDSLKPKINSKSKFVVSVLKEPEKIDALQSTM